MQYPKLIKICHWLAAFLIIGLFAVGFWMVDLSYYSEWYHEAPAQHKNFGLVLFVVMLVRLFAKLILKSPPPIGAKWERRTATATHILLYLLVFFIIFSGYLISTAKGQGIQWFNLIEVPALLTEIPEQADLAGAMHKYLAYSLIALVLVHAIGALKHHFIDKDAIFKRII
ncbi:cytochrome b [Gayadomonas joobiniege]|uniref:cytochrome b n=1 Tax=Gayadomonas joobiniege TaxID=1234606 RepID=UPI000373E4EC|nr:cytochrome b [Gayadomonas joobiniege]